MSDFGRAIRDDRHDLKWSMKRLAQEADIDERTVGRIERGEVENPQKLGVLQRVLKEARLQAGLDTDRDHPAGDPRLSEATFAELIGALATRYGKDIRAAHTGGAGIDSLDELPPDVAARARSGAIPAGRNQPNERNPEE